MPQTAKVIPFRRSEEPRHMIADGIHDWEDQRLNTDMDSLRTNLPHEPEASQANRPKFMEPRPWYLGLMDAIGTGIILFILVNILILIYVNLTR
jgi:hypothetical protein